MSVIIKVKNKQVATIGEMHRLALKMIFDKKSMTGLEEALLEHSVNCWPKKVDLDPEERRQLKIVVNALIDNEDGKFYALKEEMIKHNLDYTKVYRNGFDGGISTSPYNK